MIILLPYFIFIEQIKNINIYQNYLNKLQTC